MKISKNCLFGEMFGDMVFPVFYAGGLFKGVVYKKSFHSRPYSVLDFELLNYCRKCSGVTPVSYTFNRKK